MILSISVLLAVAGVVGRPVFQPRDVVVPSFSTLLPISDTVLNLVKEDTRDVSHQSWELGTMAEAYLEIDWPELSVYGAQGVPPPRSVTSNNNLNNMSSVLDIANYVIGIRPQGILPLMVDGSVGDPASVGIAVLIANWTKASRPDEVFNDYDTPLQQQLSYLLDNAPRTVDGAISHRSDQVQLWSDNVFMVPPFLAFYGALSRPFVSDWLLYQAYQQISLYRNYLFDATPGLWRHIALGNYQDPGHWSTGNGWAAAGMLRVLLTINQTSVGTLGQFAAAQRDLQNWTTEIVNNIWTYQQPSGCLRNYADVPTTFEDSSSTALLASVTYRLVTLPVSLRGAPNGAATDPTAIDYYNGTLNPLITLTDASLQAAHKARDCVRNNLNDTSGWLINVVDPNNLEAEGSQSPEGQSFVLMMEAAWRDWYKYIAQQEG